MNHSISNRLSRKSLRFYLAVPAIAVMASFVLVGAASAQEQGSPTPPTTQTVPATPVQRQNLQSRRDLAEFDHYLATHPDARKALMKNPNLINNPQFLQAHPHLQNFLNHHPVVKNYSAKHPYEFMNHARRFHQQQQRRRETGNGNAKHPHQRKY